MKFIEGTSSVGYTLMMVRPKASPVFKTWARKPHPVVLLWAKIVLWARWFGL